MGQPLTKKNSSKEEKLKNVAKEEYFIRNGGILLEKQIALCQGQEKGARQLRILTLKDIEKATNCYDPNLIVANVFRALYKVTLEDRKMVIKSFRGGEQHSKLIDLTLNEAAAGMVMNHGNIARLYGCCLETCIPILVYEYLPNGGLFDHLHGNLASRKALKWDDRLRIATDTAYALSYMHNAFSKPVVHRDVKSLSILLDDSFHAKFSNMGHSVSITPGDTSQKLPVRGTPGYIDPEYMVTEELTEKCDVYSFGVLLLELLTGREPVAMARSGTDLVDVFVSAMESNCMMELIDTEVMKSASMSEIHGIARLALTCVAMKGVERPTMIDVAKELWQIQGRPTKAPSE